MNMVEFHKCCFHYWPLDTEHIPNDVNRPKIPLAGTRTRRDGKDSQVTCLSGGRDGHKTKAPWRERAQSERQGTRAH